jgi:HTH-type transcriptional regulator/antitoxin HipB
MAASGNPGVLVGSMSDVGALVRDARSRLGWTQAELCERLGVSRPWLVDIERGRHDRAEMGKVLRLLAAVGVELRARPVDRSAPKRDFDLDAFLDEVSGDDG